jgi:hypothetical protein
MIQQLYTYLLSPEASVVGNWLSLLLTILGFSWTIWTARKSRQAAEQAAKAAREALESVRKLDTIQGLSQAISMLEEIKRLHRQQAWTILPDRYNAIRRLLVELRSTNPQFTDEQTERIQEAIVQFSAMEVIVDKMQLPETKPPDVGRMNRFITQQMDRLVELLVEVRDRPVP